MTALGTFSTGINIKNLHNLIFGSSWKGIIKVLQSIGRILRLAENDQEALLIDVWDDFSYGDYVCHPIRHGEEKISIYEEEGHTYKIYDLEFKA